MNIFVYNNFVRLGVLYRTHCPPAAVTICPAWPVWYRVQTGAVCPASGRRYALALVCPGSGTACPATCAVQSVRMRWGWGLHRRGIQAALGVGWVMPAIKFFKEKGVFRVSYCKLPTPPSQIRTHPIVQVSKNSEKNKKTPYGAIECVILAKERWN